MKVLVLTPYLPHRQIGHGGGTAVRDLVRCLARQHEVLVAALVRPGEEELSTEVEALGAKVAAIPFLDRGADSANRLNLVGHRLTAATRALRSGYPHYVEKYWSPELSRRVIQIVENFAPDAIQVEYLQMSLLARDLHRHRAGRAASAPRLILNSHELGSLPRTRRAQRASNPLARRWLNLEAAAWRRLQVDACDWCDQMLCVTPGDLDRFAEMGGHRLVHVPLGMDIDEIAADWQPMQPESFLFVGSYNHRPNRLTSEWLLKIWPRLRVEFPAGRLQLVGRGSDTFLAEQGGIRHWNEQGVEALGFVEDLRSLFRRSHLFVAPIPEGGGIKIKILEAMARGIPVVTTAVGAEGIDDGDDPTLYLAECDESFAEAVIQAARDPRSNERARRGRTLIETEFSWQAIVERLTRLYGNSKETI